MAACLPCRRVALRLKGEAVEAQTCDECGQAMQPATLDLVAASETIQLLDALALACVGAAADRAIADLLERVAYAEQLPKE